MATRNELIDTLKKALKQAGLTYADVAEQLQLSEISIKRSFSKKSFTLERLEAISECAGLDLSSLVRLTDDSKKKISTLTLEQEQELVADPKFLLVAICVQNAWQMDEIIQYYTIDEHECLRYLIRLDRHGLIHLLPNNRIRRLLAQDFRWIKRGPIETFFEKTVQSEFMSSHFTRENELRIYMMGMLSPASIKNLSGKLEMLAREFSSLQLDDAKLPATERKNTGLMLAIRPWELSVFAEMVREKDQKATKSS